MLLKISNKHRKNRKTRPKEKNKKMILIPINYKIKVNHLQHHLIVKNNYKKRKLKNKQNREICNTKYKITWLKKE
jgi:hypothetical protein